MCDITKDRGIECRIVGQVGMVTLEAGDSGEQLLKWGDGG